MGVEAPSSRPDHAGLDRCALVLNAGSSSLKAKVITAEGAVLWSDQTAWPQGPKPADALLQGWLLPALALWHPRLSLVGHRVVHGGERFTAPTRLAPPAVAALEQLLPLAPLHNGPALELIRWLGQWRPELPQWACFDTAFHHTLPPEAHTYAIPAPWRAQGLRRFGFHGLNHEHVRDVVARQGGPAGAPRRLISAHLGAGCSLCAIQAGRSIATTMGFTPMEGLVMATRSGSIDPGLLLHQLRHGVSSADLDRVLNQGSGLLGLSGLSGHMAELRRAAAQGHAGARLAIAVFRHQLLQGIGSMAACLGGVDVLALTGGIGEHDAALRQELERALAWLQPFTLVVIPADEEGLIARQCFAADARSTAP